MDFHLLFVVVAAALLFHSQGMGRRWWCSPVFICLTLQFLVFCILFFFGFLALGGTTCMRLVGVGVKVVVI